jgi:hypothetical protein
MSTRTFSWTAGAALFLLSLAALPAAAQNPTFYFRASAATNGFPGAYSVTAPVIAGATSNSASSYPMGVHFNGGTMYAEATSSSYTEPGHASAAAYSYAHRTSTDVYPTTNILANAQGSFVEYGLNVESATLPAGTEVTLKFRAATAIAKFSNENTYYGTARVDLQIGSSVGYVTWTTQPGVPDPEVQSPEITVKTRVGSRLYFTGKAYASTAAWFYNSNNRVTDGKLGLEVSMDVERIDAEWDVTVRTDSGKIFQPMP